MPMLADVYGGQPQNDTFANPGMKSLASGMQTWVDRIKKKRQKKALIAVGELLREDNIPLDKFYSLMIDADLDPATMMSGLEPILKEKKRQQFAQAGPEWMAAVQRAQVENGEIPMGELSAIGSKYGLGMGDVLLGIKMIMDSGAIPTVGQKIQQKGQRLEGYRIGAKMGTPFAGEEKAQQYQSDTGFKPYEVPGAQEQALASGAAQGMPGPTIVAQQGKQEMIAGGAPQQTQFFPGAPTQPKPPTSRAGLAAASMPDFKAMVEAEESIKAKHREPRATGKEKLMSHPEERARAKELRQAEMTILNPENVESQAVQVAIDFFNENTDKSYRYKRTQGEVKRFWPDTPSRIERVGVEEPGETKTDTEGSWRDYLK